MHDSRLDGLLGAMRRTAGDATLDLIGDPIELSGGFYADMWKLELRGTLSGEFVARIMPDAGFAQREIAVQDELAKAGFAVPAVRLFGEPDDGFDAAWMVMDVAPGTPLLGDLSVRAVVSDPQGLYRMPDRLATHAAALHRVDPAPIIDRLGLADDLADDMAYQVQVRRIEAEACGRDDLVAVTDWLDANRSDSGPPVLVHGDLHPFNVMTDGDTDTVIDWTTAAIAPPAVDLAFTMMMLELAPVGGPAPVRALVRRAGAFAARRFLEVYERESGGAVDPDQLRWARVFQMARALVEVGGWANAGELGDHEGHPWLMIEDDLRAGVRELSGHAVRSVR